MTSRNWPNEFVRACATISLVLCWTLGAQTKVPGIALLDAGDAAQWQNWTREAGWQVITPAGAPGADIDSRVRALATAVESAIQNGSVDPARVYIAGRGDTGAAEATSQMRAVDGEDLKVLVVYIAHPAGDVGGCSVPRIYDWIAVGRESGLARRELSEFAQGEP